MGFVRTKVKVINITDRSKSAEVDVLVDTGARYPMLPRGVLESIGVEPEVKRKFQLANGDSIEREVGYVLLRWQDRQTPCEVIFGEPQDAALLGVMALEGMGIEIDPKTGELKTIDVFELL